MMARKGLGRGLDALIPPGGEPEGRPPAPSAEGSGLFQCPVDKITVGRWQPRQKMDEARIAELADSIKTQGILAPLMVRPRVNGGYELIAGERRLRAARMLGLAAVPVVVREVDDRGALELALVENLQREDLDPIEEAAAYRRLMTEFDYTQAQLAERVGKARSTITNTMRLLSLPEDIIADVREGRLTAGHALALAGAGSEAQMRRIRDLVLHDGISVREAERLAAGGREKKPSLRSKARKREKEAHLREMEERLMRSLGTKVTIVRTRKGGQINAYFFSEEELDRLYRRLLG
jgi:ParB family chromosome partitioning protein